MTYTLWMMTILLPLVVQKEFRKLVLGALVNMVYTIQYIEDLDQALVDYDILIKSIFAAVLIVLFVLNWYGSTILSGIYVGVILTIIIHTIHFLMELIITISNIVYQHIII